MKFNSFNLLILIVFLLAIFSCEKGDTYCKMPIEITGVYGVDSLYLPTETVHVNLQFKNDSETNIENTLYSFSTPDVFINPKGDYTEDVVNAMNYQYVLKDTINYPSSVEVLIYSFNDCGESKPISVLINYL